MIKYVNYDIVFQEFPDEVTLAINCSLCPNNCPGCHSAYLAKDIGERLTQRRLLSLISEYENQITCVALMGGDNDPAEVARLLKTVKLVYGDRLRTGWYSGRQELPSGFDSQYFNYVKLGPYNQELGPLKSKTTNQIFYKVGLSGELLDMTYKFWNP